MLNPVNKKCRKLQQMSGEKGSKSGQLCPGQPPEGFTEERMLELSLERWISHMHRLLLRERGGCSVDFISSM
jgi:hypothetical protein